MKQYTLYFFLSVAILVWWGIAFREDWISQPIAQPITSVPDTNERHLLLQSVNGDTEAMLSLLSLWESEDLSHSLRAELLTLRDDLQTLPPPLPTAKRLLPQSLVAASFLLTLVPAEWIVALPPEMRKNSCLFPEEKLKKISLDLNRYQAEKLFLVKPEIAFVATYSNPSTVEALQQQGMEIFTLGALESPEQILFEFQRLGDRVGLSRFSQLISRFIHLFFAVIDFRLANLKLHPTFPDKILYILHHQQFNIPTPKTLTGQLLSRMQIDSMMNAYCAHCSPYEWFVHADKERMMNLDPDALILASAHPEQLSQTIQNDRALKRLHAVKKDRIVQVQETIQQMPSLHMAIAYYDLYSALNILVSK